MRANRQHRQTHGQTTHPLYWAWCGMHARCRDRRHVGYRYYGGRGITVCERWTGSDGFANFLADMGDRPDGWHLHRIDNDGSYLPTNCVWISHSDHIRMHNAMRDA